MIFERRASGVLKMRRRKEEEKGRITVKEIV